MSFPEDPFYVLRIVCIKRFFKWAFFLPHDNLDVLNTMFRQTRRVGDRTHGIVELWGEHVKSTLNTSANVRINNAGTAFEAFGSAVNQRDNIVDRVILVKSYEITLK